jgi:hypothetical protein
MGRGLEVFPVAGSDDEQWMSIGHLLITKFDETNDPTGNYQGTSVSGAGAHGARQG